MKRDMCKDISDSRLHSTVHGIEIEIMTLAMNISALTDFAFICRLPLDINLGSSYFTCALSSFIALIAKDCENQEFP